MTIYAQGKQHEWIVESALRRDARRFEEDKRIELRTQSKTAGRAELRFLAFSRLYAVHAELHLGASTWVARRSLLVTFVEHFGSMRLSKVGSEIESYKRARVEARIRPSTINTELNALRAMLRWGTTQTPPLLDKMPSVKPLPTSGLRRVHFWTRSDVRAAYAAACPRLRPLLHFMLDTGVRKGEAIAALWAWVDWDARMLRIPAGGDEWTPKSRRSRDIPLSPELLESLRRRAGRPQEAIFLTSTGSAYRKFPERLWDEMRDAADLQGGPHTTRHTFAAHFLAARPDLQLLSKVLGHSQLRTTELYSHLLPGHLDQARGVVSLAPPGKDWAKVAGRK